MLLCDKQQTHATITVFNAVTDQAITVDFPRSLTLFCLNNFVLVSSLHLVGRQFFSTS